MPSLNLDLDYFTNPKVLRLAGLLGAEAFVIPIRLWCYVAKHHAETGKLVGYSKQEIERIVEWSGEPGRCVDALVAVKLLEKTRAHRPNRSAPQTAPEQPPKHPQTYVVHAWLEHAGHIVYYKRRAKSGAKARWAKYANASSITSSIDVSSYASSNAPTSHPISSHSDPKQNKKRSEEEEERRSEQPPPTAQVLSVEEIRTRWNQIPGVKRCKRIAGALLTQVKGLTRDQPPDFWDKLFAEVANSRFLTGRIPPGKDRVMPFRADLDWVSGPINLGKVLSGKFDDNQLSPGQCQVQIKRPGQAKAGPCGEFSHATIEGRELCKSHHDERKRLDEARRNPPQPSPLPAAAQMLPKLEGESMLDWVARSARERAESKVSS